MLKVYREILVVEMFTLMEQSKAKWSQLIGLRRPAKKGMEHRNWTHWQLTLGYEPAFPGHFVPKNSNLGDDLILL